MADRIPAHCYQGNDYTHTAVTPTGRTLRRYHGEWCAETQRAGVWRSAVWLGTVTAGELLDVIATPKAAGPIEGQQELSL